jgi:Flp pilus assembly protein TadD
VKAIPDYEKYVSLISDPIYLSHGFMKLGLAHYSTASLQKALDDFTRVIELRPTWPNGYSARAVLYREMKKTTLAEADEKRAAELSALSK